jgi:hypothetical protein
MGEIVNFVRRAAAVEQRAILARVTGVPSHPATQESINDPSRPMVKTSSNDVPCLVRYATSGRGPFPRPSGKLRLMKPCEP